MILPIRRPRSAAAPGALLFALAGSPARADAGALVRIPASTSRNFHPAVALGPAGSVLALWQGFLRERDPRLFGADPQAPGRADLAPLPVVGEPVREPVLASEPGSRRVHLLYRAGGARADVYWSVLADRGWSPARNLSVTPGDSRFPALTLSGRELTVVWEDATGGPVRFWFARSTDGGESWSSARPTGIERLSASFQGHFSLAADRRGGVHLVWQDGSTSLTDIYWSALRGGSWSPPVNVSATPGEYSGEPALAAAGGLLELVWVEQDGVDEDSFALARAALAEGEPWRRLPAPGATAMNVFRPLLVAGAAASSPSALLWESLTPTGRALRLSRPPFRDSVVISDGVRDARRAQAVHDASGALHLVFDAVDPDAAGGRSVYYRRID